MNRYDIKNKTTQQITHSYVAEIAMETHEGWGAIGSYDIIITDLTLQLKAEDIASYQRMKDKDCDDAVNTLLAPNESITHVMFALFAMYVATDLAGTSTPEQIAAAKAELAGYLNLMGQIQTLRAQRDAEVAAYIASKG